MKNVVKIFIISKLILFLFIILTTFIGFPLDEGVYEGVKGILNPFTAFDSEHYLTIAEKGYAENHLYVFFPLYPLLTKVISSLGLPLTWSGVLISWISNFLFGVLLYKILEEKHRKIGLWLWFLSPISIYSISVYTESLFLLLSISSWYFLNKKKFLLCGIFLGLSMLTRNTAYILCFAFLIHFILNKKKMKYYLKTFISAGSIGITYPAYLLFETGNPFIFTTMQSYFGRSSSYPWQTIWRDITLLFNHSGYEIVIIFNFIAIFLVFFLSVKFYKKDFGMTIYMIINTILPLCMPATEGLPGTISILRYVFGLFPIYIFLSKLNYKKIHKIIGIATYLFIMSFVAMIFVLKKFSG